MEKELMELAKAVGEKIGEVRDILREEIKQLKADIFDLNAKLTHGIPQEEPMVINCDGGVSTKGDISKRMREWFKAVPIYEFDDLKEKLNASEKYIKDLEFENDRLSKSWHKAVTSPKVINCNVDFSEIEKKIEKLTRASNNKISALKEENKQLKEAIENIKASGTVRTVVSETDKDRIIDDLRRENNRNEHEIRSLEKQISDLCSENYNWKERNHELSVRNRKLAKQVGIVE